MLKYEVEKYLISDNLAKLKRLEVNILSEMLSITRILPENLSEIQKASLDDLQIKLGDLYKLRAEGAFIRLMQRCLNMENRRLTIFLSLRKTGLSQILFFR